MINAIRFKAFCSIFVLLFVVQNFAFSKDFTLKVKTHQNKVILNWVNSETQKTTYFIQRSHDNKVWENIQEIEGAQLNENSEYYFSDVRPAIGENNYRIKQVTESINGKYSNVVKIQNSQVGVEKLLNLVADKSTKTIQLYSTDAIEKILILDGNGKLIHLIYDPKSLIDCSFLNRGNYRFVIHKKNIQEATITKNINF